MRNLTSCWDALPLDERVGLLTDFMTASAPTAQLHWLLLNDREAREKEPGMMMFRSNFEDYAAIAGWVSAGGCCAVDVSALVHIQVGLGVGPVRAFEGVQHGVVAPGIEPKDHPASAGCAAGGIGGVAAKGCCTVEIAKAVKDNAGERSEPIRASGEIVKNGFFAAAVDFEDGSVTEIGAADRAAAIAGDAVHVAPVIRGEPAVGEWAAVFSLEGVNDGEVAVAMDLEDGSAAERAGESRNCAVAEGA
jgi:hypothetical protein